jgi:hypothetical protein
MCGGSRARSPIRQILALQLTWCLPFKRLGSSNKSCASLRLVLLSWRAAYHVEERFLILHESSSGLNAVFRIVHRMNYA